MDAHLFRLLAPIVTECLYEARVEAIHAPLPELYALTLYKQGKKYCILLFTGKKHPLLFLARKNPLPNPAAPPAHILFLRKHVAGRRLGAPQTDWLGRRMAFAVPGAGGAAGYLVLDLRQGALFLPGLPETFARPVIWPDPLEAASLAGEAIPAAAAVWQRFPVLTPALRKTLHYLDTQDAAALVRKLAAGGGDIYAYGNAAGTTRLTAWQLPQPLLAGICPLPLEQTPTAILECLRAVAEPVLLQYATEKAVAARQKPVLAAAKQREKLLGALTAEHEQLEKKLALREDAIIIQANLWRFAPGEKHPVISLPDPLSCNGTARRIQLDPRVTVLENMRSMFRQSVRAMRGLAILAARIDSLRAGKIALLPADKKTVPGLTPLARRVSAKNWKEFRSSDGFLLLRGKNAKGNRELCKLAQPFDIWLHAEDGPSAHLIIRRDHAAQEIPERSLLEAGTLVALKSSQHDAAKAAIVFALAKDVHPVKGAPDGTVRIAAVWKSLVVAPDHTLEEKLDAAP